MFPLQGRRMSGGEQEPDDDTICAVCFEGWTEPSNQIMFCDACGIAVHQGCYGVSTVPAGDWYCGPCQHGSKPVRQSIRGHCHRVLCLYAVPR